MRTKFNHLNEFANIRRQCIFCKQPLTLLLSNFMGSLSFCPRVHIKSIDDVFTISDPQLGHYGSVGLKTNKVFNLGEKHPFIQDFEKLWLTVFLQCVNKLCKHNYILCSTQLKYTDKTFNVPLEKRTYHIEPYDLYMESFNIDDTWVQNLWSEPLTLFYSIKNYDKEPIEIQLIDWSQIKLSNIYNKISTIITFS